ncbi:MAG: hypothetical protein ACYTG0_43075 [Planctomycetota bacterium]|jgi:hypothetical protein
MKRSILILVMALAALVLAKDPPMATAADELPFSADAVVEFVDYYKNGFITAGFGNATHLGEIAVMGQVRVFGDRSTSTIMLTAANGDSIVMQSESAFDPELGHFIGTYTVSEGTGRFAGATGYGVIEPVPLGGGQFNVLYDGVISY